MVPCCFAATAAVRCLACLTICAALLHCLSVKTPDHACAQHLFAARLATCLAISLSDKHVWWPAECIRGIQCMGTPVQECCSMPHPRALGQQALPGRQPPSVSCLPPCTAPVPQKCVRSVLLSVCHSRHGVRHAQSKFTPCMLPL